MIRKYLTLCLLLMSCNQLMAQQYGLFNTKTLFDGFENPAQKTFVLDSSRKFASNFFLPYFGVNAAAKGNDDVIRKLINEGIYKTSDIPLGTNEMNSVYQNSNFYLLTFKIFKSYKYQKELGFSWQMRTDAHLDYSNETLAVFGSDPYNKFSSGAIGNDPFNSSGYVQSYHQFSISYRENYDKQLAFGVKLSLLSGTTYNNLKITHSRLDLDPVNDIIDLTLQGQYKASFLKTKDLPNSTYIPTFKNPGVSVSLGTTYTSKKGVFIMANIKDLGVIKWANSSYVKNIDDTFPIFTGPSNHDIQKQVTDIAIKDISNRGFYSLTNAKADFMISKTFSFYTPSLILSKNLFYDGGEAAFINRFRYSDFSISAVPAYSLNNLFLFGMQGMYQTPNFEVFLGSDNILKTASQAKGIIDNDAAIGSGYNGASFYMGLGIKFGRTVEHPQNSSTMPGIGDDEPGLFKRLFSIFSNK